jgi:Flp pilus assembly protein TadD
MKTFIKIIFVSAVALSVVSPAFAAYQPELESQIQVSNSGARTQHLMREHNAVRAHRGIDANAYAPADAPVGQAHDFGIGGADSGGAL